MGASQVFKLKPSTSQPQTPSTNLNLPNCLTGSRILLIPVFILLFSVPTPGRSWAAALVFFSAALTDLLDGYVARRRGQVTNLGKLLDPVADKLLVASGLILLVQFQRIGVWVVIAMIAREIIVTGGRAVAAREGFVVQADSLGKIKVVCQIVGILCLILQDVLLIPFINLHLIGTIILYVALILALVSGWRYLMDIWRKISPQYL